MIAIKIEDLKKAYKTGFLKKDKFFALKGISMEIKEGELFGFLGPNGAGKTTTILIMLNLIKKDSGKVLFFEKELDKGFEIFKDIGYVPEEPYLYNYLKLKEFLYLGAKLSNIDEKDLEERMENYLNIFNLMEKRDRIIKNLSKGQKQRVLLTLNFLIQPKILILDEPFRGLDPEGIKTVRDEIENLWKKGSTIFLSSHIISEVEMLCSKVAIINEGSIIWEGNPKDIPKKGGGFKISFKLPQGEYFEGIKKIEGEGNLFEKIVKNQEEMLEFINNVNSKGGEILEILREIRLEEWFLEKIREN